MVSHRHTARVEEGRSILFLVADVARKEALAAWETEPSIGALVVLAHALVGQRLALDD